jgi:hypothetical protein
MLNLLDKIPYAALIKESEKIIRKYEDIWSIVELSFEFMG